MEIMYLVGRPVCEQINCSVKAQALLDGERTIYMRLQLEPKVLGRFIGIGLL